MKFSKDVLEVLQNFSQINQSMQFREGRKQTTVAAVDKNIIGISEFDVEIPRSFAIYELNKFLGIMSLMNEPEIELDDEYAVIRDEKQEVKYRYCDPRVITSWPEDRVLSLATTDVTFELSKEILTKLNKNVSLLDVEHIRFISEDGKIFVKTHNLDDPNYSQSSFEIGESDLNFDMVFKIKTLPIMQGNYVLEFCRNKLTRWTNKDKSIHYYIPALKQSVFER